MSRAVDPEMVADIDVRSTESSAARRPGPVSSSRLWRAATRRHGLFVVIFTLAAFLLTLNVDTPFQATHEGNGTMFTGVAANHLRLGLAYTKGQDVLSVTEYGKYPTPVELPDIFDRYLDGPVTPVRYGDHPPLLGLTVAAAIAVFGADYGVVRAVPIAYTLAGLILFYLLVCRLFDVGVSRVAAFLYVTFPVLAYFGRNVNHESPTLFWALALITGYVRWRENGAKRHWWAALMVVAIVLGGGYGWPIYYCAALLFGLDWLSRRRFDRKLLLLTVVPAFLMGVAVLGHIAWSAGGSLEHLMNALQMRTSQGDEGVTARSWLQRMAFWYGPESFGLALVAAPLAIVFLILRLRIERFSQRIMVVTLFGSWGAAHILLFRNGAWVHEYWLFYLVPFFAIAIAWPAVEMARRFVQPLWLRSAAFVIPAALIWQVNSDRIFLLYSNTAPFGRVPVEPFLIPWW